MSEISKPDFTNLWASGGAIVAPSNVKIQTGWGAEVPPFQWENWSQNRQDTYIAHINQHGIPVWDNLTQYQWAASGTKSLVMGSDGVIYRAVSISTGQDPTLDSTDTYWTPAFSSTGDSYTKTASDARYLQTANNLSDVSNAATARTNLSVFSQAQVTALTTLSVPLQSQQQLLNNVLLTPLQLGYAFQGANASLTTAGYQKLPGGMVIQWGNQLVPASTTQDYSFPTPFPSSGYQIVVSFGVPATNSSNGAIISASTYRLQNTNTVASQSISWMAIGH